ERQFAGDHVAQRAAWDERVERIARHERDDGIERIEPQRGSPRVEDLDSRHDVGERLAVRALDVEVVAERETRERVEVRVAVRRDDGDAGLARQRAAVEEPRGEREAAPTGTG